MVLGEFPPEEIEKMASSSKLRNYYLKSIKEDEFVYGETVDTIINLALGYFLHKLNDEYIDNNCIVCKECLIMDYLDLERD